MASKNNPEVHSCTQDPKLSSRQKFNIDVISGLIAGVSNSGLFNPWDRALYLSVKYNRPFLSMDNFKSPYQGVSQTLVQRAFLGSIYYIAQGELKTHLFPYFHHHLGFNHVVSQFFVGMSAGSVGGALTNSISAIKYHTWGQENASFMSSVRDMWHLGGIKPFLKGTSATMTRDMVFGSTYEMLRHVMNTSANNPKDNISDLNSPYNEFIRNASAAGVATVASSPFNYVRNMHYATPPNIKPPSMYESLTKLWNESKKDPQVSHLGRLNFFQKQLRVGWGTARVAVGMAVGQKLFDWSRDQLSYTCRS